MSRLRESGRDRYHHGQAFRRLPHPAPLLPPLQRRAVRSSPGTSSSDPTSIPRADLSSSSAKAVVSSTNRRSVGSSSSASPGDLPAPTPRDLSSAAKVVAKCLAYDDDLTFPTASSTLPEEGDLAPLLELPDPDDASSFTVISASPDDAMAASADSTVTEVAAPADSTTDSEQGPLPRTEMELVLAELLGARGLSTRSKRLFAALVEAAAAGISPNTTATALRLRRAAFWGKVRVGVLAATVFAMAATDVALLGGGRGNGHYEYDVLSPT